MLLTLILSSIFSIILSILKMTNVCDYPVWIPASPLVLCLVGYLVYIIVYTMCFHDVMKGLSAKLGKNTLQNALKNDNFKIKTIKVDSLESFEKAMAEIMSDIKEKMEDDDNEAV